LNGDDWLIIGCWWQKWWLADNLKVMTDWYLHGDKWFFNEYAKTDDCSVIECRWFDWWFIVDDSLMIEWWWLKLWLNEWMIENYDLHGDDWMVMTDWWLNDWKSVNHIARGIMISPNLRPKI